MIIFGFAVSHTKSYVQHMFCTATQIHSQRTLKLKCRQIKVRVRRVMVSGGRGSGWGGSWSREGECQGEVCHGIGRVGGSGRCERREVAAGAE